MKKSILIFLTLLFFVVFGCSDSKEDEINGQVDSASIADILGQNKKWKRVSLTSDIEKSMNGKNATDWYQLMPECYQDNTITFNAFLFSSGDYELYSDFADMQMGDDLCKKNESIKRDNIFRWTLDAKNKILSIEFSEYDNAYLYGEIGYEIKNVENWYITSISSSEIVFDYVKEWGDTTFNMNSKFLLIE